jgi:hypothetical protein
MLARPSRPRLSELRADVARCGSAAEAWRQLVGSGALPAGSLDDPGRRFVHERSNDCRDPIREPRGAQPERLEHCALIAADMPGIAAAEAAARLLAERLRPWGAPPLAFVLWWFLPPDRLRYATHDTRPGVHYALMFAANALTDTLRGGNTPPPAHLLLGYAAQWSALWRDQAAAGAVVRPDARLPTAGMPFATLPDPFEPLAALEATGYVTLEWIGATGDARGAVPLICPLDADAGQQASP